MNDVAKKLRASAVVLTVGEALYALGFAAEYMVVRTGRGIAAVAHRLARWCRNARHTIIATAFPGAAQMFKDLLAPLYLFFKGLGAVAAHANDVRRERGFGASVKAAGRYFVGGLKRNLSLLPRTAMCTSCPCVCWPCSSRSGTGRWPSLCAGCAGERPDRWLCGQ